MSDSRRSFLKHATLAASAIAFPAVVKSANANSKLQVVSVGADGMAFSDIKNIGAHAEVQYVGFCDIDSSRFGKVDAEFPGIAHFTDYREMFAKLADKFDAVNIGIPDHMHAKVAIDAMRRGKHVYCQKPLAHTVWEARQMRLEAAKAKVVTQMGNQIHSALEYRLGTRLIKEGAIGKVKEVQSWVSVTGNERNKRLAPAASSKVPSHVNWDLWLGVAPKRAYAPCYHPFVWRDWQDFGGGALGDFGCHILDPVFTALDLNAPIQITAENSGINEHIWPTSQQIEYIFPGNERIAGQTLKVTWTDGGLRPDRKLAQMPDNLDLPKSGSLFIGEAGNLVLAHVAGPRLYPLDKFTGFKYPKEQGLSHWHRWVDACRGGEKTSDGFDYAGPLSETVQLGNVATRLAIGEIDQRTGRPLSPKTLEWDTKAFAFKNNPNADKLLAKSYRKGWAI
ncbi:MAG: Gfo/Idh/MocA family oxidoreductase [Verrucomicrobia bacterium]|nr:Gfo/Idh/MocA family oxidoreductase [Verrucomicrobiota bacterium]